MKPWDGLSWRETTCPCGGSEHPQHEVDDLYLDAIGGWGAAPYLVDEED